jgi:carbonic anhydrase/acetyltransferase-like protein (isoleucine patch superfamily)
MMTAPIAAIARRNSKMPIYSLGGRRPTLPAEGRFWIAPSACLIGDVVVGLDVGIWFGAVLRGDNEPIVIGARTNIQESCTLHTDMGSPLAVGEDCTIGHNVILHGCAVGDGSLIGMGAVVLNGARIGRGSLVGAGALVTENKTFDDFSLIIGSPAKAARTMDRDAIEELRRSAAHYVGNWRRYASGLKRIDPAD